MTPKSTVTPFLKQSKIEEQTSQTVELLRHAVDTMSNYFLMWDREDRLVVCNEKVFELYPESRDIFIVGDTFEDIMRMGFERGDFEPPEKMTSEQWIQHRVALHKRGDYVEVRQIKGRWLQIRDQKTSEGYIISTAMDVTHLKEQEKQLEEQFKIVKKQARQLEVAKERAAQAESHLRDALDTMSDAFMLWDKEDRLILHNEKLFEIYPQARDIYIPGRTYEEILKVGVEMGAFILPEGVTKEEWVERRVAGHKSGNYQNVRFMQGRWLQIRDQRTKQGNIVSTNMDIGYLKEREQQLEITKDQAEKARKQTEKALKQAKKAWREADLVRAQAEQATKAKSDFLAMLSHEVRTPLHTMMNMGQLLLKSHLDVPQHDKVMTILRSSEGLRTIIDDLLDFSKLEAGKISLEETDFDLKAMIEGVMTLYSVPVQQKDLSFSYYIDPKLPRYFKGEGGKIRQILLNLVGNAVKFTDEGHIVIHIKAVSGDTDPLKISIEVEDTGIGLSPIEQKKIFTPFTQAREDIAQHYGGAGLGLTICQKFAESMNGEIGVKSNPKRGSTFWVTCAVKPSDVVPETFPWQGFKNDFDMPSMKILVVEDNVINQKTTREVLDHFNHRADIVSNGQEALYQLMQKTYDLVMMDVQLPGMDGYETTRRIRTLPASACSIPVIGMSAQSTKKDREMGQEARMSAYLPKPVNMWHLQKAIADVKGYAEKRPSREYKDFEQLKEDQNDRVQLVAIDQNYLKQSLEILTFKDMQMFVTDYEQAIKDYDHKFWKLIGRKDKDYESIYRLSSDFKCAGGYLGLQRLTNIIDNITAGAEEKDSNKIERYYTKAMNEIKIVLPILKRLFEVEDTTKPSNRL